MEARDTLIRLLASFRRDVEMCIENESKDFMLSQPGGDGGQSNVADPILLGDFVVDAYNRYLEQARGLTDNPVVDALASVTPLGAAGGAPEGARDDSRPRTHGADPRLGKMAEVMLATGQLLTALEAEASEATAARTDTLATLISAIDALGGPIGDARDALDQAHGETTGTMGEAVAALVERYNTYADLVHETCDDPIVPRLFGRIDTDDAGTSRLLAELATRTDSLVAYLRKLVARSEPASGMRGEVWDGAKPALPG